MKNSYSWTDSRNFDTIKVNFSASSNSFQGPSQTLGRKCKHMLLKGYLFFYFFDWLWTHLSSKLWLQGFIESCNSLRPYDKKMMILKFTTVFLSTNGFHVLSYLTCNLKQDIQGFKNHEFTKEMKEKNLEAKIINSLIDVGKRCRIQNKIYNLCISNVQCNFCYRDQNFLH